MLAQLTYIVDATSELREQAKQRAAATSDAKLKEQLNGLMQKLEDFRSTLVSVKEGGMITGEKKLREHLGELYGAVNGYSGRPTQSQIESTACSRSSWKTARRSFSPSLVPFAEYSAAGQATRSAQSRVARGLGQKVAVAIVGLPTMPLA